MTSSASAPQMGSRPASPWLESAAWDSLWILNVLWLTPMLAVAWAAGQASLLNAALLKVGVILLWGGHILSPILSAWRSPGLRGHIRKDLGRWLLWPLVVLLGSIGLAFFALYDSPLADSSLPAAGRAGAYQFLLGLFLLWNTWHFSSQHFGVLSIYRYKAGPQAADSRRADRLFTVLCTCVLLPLAWFLQSERLGPFFRFLPEPSDSGLGRNLVVGFSVLAGAVMLVRELRQARPSWGRAGTLIAVALQPALAAVSYPLFNFVLFSMSHWIIALALSSRLMASYPNANASSTTPAVARGSLARFLVAYGVLIVLSVPMYVLFWSDRVASGANFLVNGIFRRAYAVGEIESSSSAVLALVVGLYFGITFVHFLYDRALYGFRRPEVRSGVAPFLFAPLSSTRD